MNRLRLACLMASSALAACSATPAQVAGAACVADATLTTTDAVFGGSLNATQSGAVQDGAAVSAVLCASAPVPASQ